MRKLLVALGITLVVLFVSVLSGCAYDGSYRYPCQDPANWKLEECQPPICNASDTCTTDLLPEEDLANGSDTTQP
jgi:hypothetical protein